MIFIDSHCHIDGEQFDEDRAEVVQRALDADVRLMLNVGTGSPKTDAFEKPSALPKLIRAFIRPSGFIRTMRLKYTDEVEMRLMNLARERRKSNRVGRDRFGFFIMNIRRKTFRKKFFGGRSVLRENSICRLLFIRAMQMMKRSKFCAMNVRAKAFRGGIMHCFGGTAEMAEDLMKIGFLISFAGKRNF